MEQILKKIGNLAAKNNLEVYVVGGYVRDVLLGKQRTDIDCTLVGDALKFSKIVANHFNSRSVIYERFRTALVPIGNLNIEFVGTRKEKYLPNSRNPITIEGTLEDDLKRRDFTVNAMAYKISGDELEINKLREKYNNETLNNDKNFIDLFNGIKHLNEKLLITPLDPIVTYNDDPLRMMRAARFASQLGFNIHSSSLQAIRELGERIAIISQERISTELLKIVESDIPSIGLQILKDTNLLKYILPELDDMSGVDQRPDKAGQIWNHKDVFQHTLQVVDNAAKISNNVWFRFAALFHDIAKPKTKKYIEGTGWHFFGHEEQGARMIEPIFRRMKLPLENLEYIKKLIRMHLRPMQLVTEEVTDSAIRRLAANAGNSLEDLLLLCKCDITSKNEFLTGKYFKNYEIVSKKVLEVQEKDKLRKFQSPIRGEEIMEICNIPPSKIIGTIKANIENAILDGIIANDYDEAKKYFLENKEIWISQK